MRGEPLKGHLDLLILAAVEPEPRHGYAVIEALRAKSAGVFDLPEGTIYPALHRLENKKFLAAEWGPTETGREAKFYRLTAKGRTQLEAETKSWARLTEVVGMILEGELS